jgi:multidrug efflux pump subunit AcrB
MTISDICIRRPVFTWVLVAIPVVLGAVAYGAWAWTCSPTSTSPSPR